jgi:predicted transposase YbfD/YdcC
MEDPRIERGKLHPLENVIFIGIAAVICGAEKWEDLEDFGSAKQGWLSSFLDMHNGVPSHDTFNRVFQALSPIEFEKHFTQWVQSLVGSIANEYVSIDGKRIRQASKMLSSSNIHIVSAWASHNEVTLGQIKTEDKSNEITAIPKLLDSLMLGNSIVTIDAMGCQKEIASKIKEGEADYILAVKENQKQLYQGIINSFGALSSQIYEPDIESNHGRIEERKYFVCNNLKYIQAKEEWQDLQSVIKVESKRIDKKTGETSYDTRYYISSIGDCEKIGKGIRYHWGIENKLHWVLDMNFNEDRSAKRKGFAAQNFSLLNKLALNLLRKEDTPISLHRKRNRAGWDNDYLWKILNAIAQ